MDFDTLERVYPEGWENEDWRIHVLPVDEDFADTYGIEIVTGRFLSGAIESDKLEAFVLNESAVKELGWSHPVGKTFGWGKRRGKVVGVVKDFHDRSLHDKVGPVVFCMWQDKWNFMKWVLLANAIAYPVSYQLVSYWLAEFAYRIDMDIWTFFASGALIWAVALGTTSYQIFKTAMTNPVEVLKHE